MTPWDPKTLPKPTRDLARLKSDISAYGYCLIAEAYAPAQIEAFRARLAEQAEAERKQGYHRRSLVQDPAGINQWINMLINKGTVFRQVLHHPLITGVLDHVLGRDHVLSEISSHITRPGAALLPLHIDQWWMPAPAMPDDDYVRPADISRTNIRMGKLEKSKTPINPPMCVNAMCMVSDFTEENGGTRLVPTSHLTGLQPDQAVPHSVPSVAATGPAGTVVIWEGRTWHAAGANVSNGDRFGLVSLYAAPQARTLQNFTLGTKAEVLEDASPELLKLLGFKVWHSYGQTGVMGSDYARPAAELIGELKP
ncbi:MAG: phytanoyl-CoA dioxygenase family protein [Alphaproteobacteria bacterium]